MIIEIILLVILIIVNAVFAASEIAFLSVNKIDLSQKVKSGDKKAKKLKQILDNPSSFLATIQIGITLAGFLASAFAAETFADQILYKLLPIIPISASILKVIIVIIVTMILSYFTLVFGELVPKRIAMNYPEKIAYKMIGFISVLSKVTYPFVWLLTKSTNLISKIFGVGEKEEQKITEEDIKLMVLEGKDIGAVEVGEQELIYNIFKLNDITAEQAMTKREDVVNIDINISLKELLSIIRQCKYTRIPVYSGQEDNIIGIFNVKDIIIKHSKIEKLDLKKYINMPLFVDKNDKIDDILKIMQDSKQSMGIVLENEEKFIGIITIEDILEELVGNIFDEYDEFEEEEYNDK